jgi:hypothetical protein
MTQLYNFLSPQQRKLNGPTTPITQRLPAITRDRFSLIRFRSPLLTESRLLSLPAGTEMFHFPAFPPTTLYIQVRVTGHISSRVSPFGNPRITARLPTPRGLSQAPTSFIGSWCQGIHRAPLKTLPTTMQHKIAQIQRCSRPLYSSQATGRNNPHPTPTPNNPQRDHRKQFDWKAESHTTHTNNHTRRCDRPCDQCPGSNTPLQDPKAHPVCPLPQDPTACQDHHPPQPAFHPTPERASVLTDRT